MREKVWLDTIRDVSINKLHAVSGCVIDEEW
jgi:hypothetical protein